MPRLRFSLPRRPRPAAYRRLLGLGAAAATALFGAVLLAETRPEAWNKGPPQDRVWAPWVESNFPFFSSVLDARHGPNAVPDNLTPRGLVLNLGHGAWACFDLDLLRMSAIWRGKPVTPSALATLSYQTNDHKSDGGQTDLPRPAGEVALANGIYPGWQAAEELSLSDPRSPAPSVQEVGRGALAPEMGRFESIQLTRDGALLHYSVGGVQVDELVVAVPREGTVAVERRFWIAPSGKTLVLAAGRPAAGWNLGLAASDSEAASLAERDGLWVATVRPHTAPLRIAVRLATEPGSRPEVPPPEATKPMAPLWPETLITRGVLASSQDAYVVDDVGLPLDNPWRRNIRLGDIQFFPDGRAAGVTLDGDVWLIDGLRGDLGAVRWKRFASGLHEPLSLAIRNGEIFVYDRNGIWRLRDTRGVGEADVYELFSNAFAQTSDNREFPNSMKVLPDGSFVISKGNQETTTLGKDNGDILSVSADGRTAEILATGFRQPFLGVNPKTGLVTASDQEGNYVPATPINIVQKGKFYGFLSSLLPKEQYPAPIAAPLTWIPHQVNPSGVGQVWLTDPRMGPLSGSMILIGYNRPELFAVLLNRRTPRLQAAVMSLTRAMPFAPLSGSVNPVDGQLYVAGFRVWDTTAQRVSGVARLRYTGAPSVFPREIVPTDRGILLRFDVPLDPSAADSGSYVAERWNYKRSWTYGSANYKLDGAMGQDRMPLGGAYLSQDRKSVFVGIPDMKAGVMQMHIGWTLKRTDGGAAFTGNAYFTPYQLAKFDPEADGFGALAVDLTPRLAPAPVEAPISIAEGRRLYELMGCMACHTINGARATGPTWRGLFGSKVVLTDAPPAVADEAYIRSAIRNPRTDIKGFEPGMPNYGGVLSDGQVESLILFIKSVR